MYMGIYEKNVYERKSGQSRLEKAKRNRIVKYQMEDRLEEDITYGT